MSLKQTFLGLCVSAVALVGTVTTVSAAGGDLGLGARPVAMSTVHVAAAAPAATTLGGNALRTPTSTRSFDDTPAVAAEEALPASSLGVLALAALMSIGLLMTRRGGRA